MRGWSLAYGAAGVLGIGIVVVGAGLGTLSWAAAVGALIAVAAQVVIVLVALPRVLSDDGAPVLATVVAVSTVLLLPLAVANEGWLAMLQFASYPLLWVISSRRRTAIAWTALSTALVLVALGWGGDVDAWMRATLIQATSFAGSLWLGLWFTAVYQHAAETQELLDRLTAAQDEVAALHREAGVLAERERLAAELHDTIAQTLAGTVLLAQRSRRELASGRLADDTLALVEEAAREALTETRTLVAAGAPVSPGAGLADAVRVLAARIARESGRDIAVRVAAVAGLDREREVALLRCAQEGLSNARRHSAARSIEVALVDVDGAVELRVTDDGVGFDPATPADGFGLAGLRARLHGLGGSLEIDGTPGAVVLTARVPRAAVGA
ncbi:hypothetical protein NS220_10940 [Microbacterium testaceum]|uniref:histidine kinase n=1 Tax=Microbacterium testaceum TaxID=2033 RepID=A0A147EW55_MICTE|nr:hypothetical protein NS220_10940 [Microbacterium testaceum]